MMAIRSISFLVSVLVCLSFTAPVVALAPPVPSRPLPLPVPVPAQEDGGGFWGPAASAPTSDPPQQTNGGSFWGPAASAPISTQPDGFGVSIPFTAPPTTTSTTPPTQAPSGGN